MGQEPLELISQQENLNVLAERALRLSHDVVAVSGFVDEVNTRTEAQKAPMEEAKAAISGVAEANEAIRLATQQLVRAVEETKIAVAGSSERIRGNAENSHAVAEWVRTLDSRMASISQTLNTVQTAVSGVGEIALQVKILAINAKIEAARAGTAGRGFSVVADEINTLSQRTSDATEGIRNAIDGLTTGIHDLRDEAMVVSHRASVAIEESSLVDEALTKIISVVDESHRASRQIDEKAVLAQQANVVFTPAVSHVISSASETAQQMQEAKQRVSGLINTSESIFQIVVQMGATTADGPLIALVQSTAAKMSRALAQAVAEREIAISDLFDDDYRPLANTNPQQFIAKFSGLTDRLFSPIQEEVLTMDSRIVFCAAVDRNGYLPTHNKKFSATPGKDPIWNAANCRNRRLFNDRVGLAAGRNVEPFLLQMYRRDMGGGVFAMMKDLSAPITVNGRHWGGLRIAYKL